MVGFCRSHGNTGTKPWSQGSYCGPSTKQLMLSFSNCTTFQRHRNVKNGFKFESQQESDMKASVEWCKINLSQRTHEAPRINARQAESANLALTMAQVTLSSSGTWEKEAGFKLKSNFYLLRVVLNWFQVSLVGQPGKLGAGRIAQWWNSQN